MYYVIVNPASKTGKGKALWNEIEPALKDENIEYKVLFSQRAGHVIKLVRDLSSSVLSQDSDSVLKLIVLGGDGTLNEVLQGISDFGRVQIGYIPTGSSNDFARDMKICTDPIVCLRNILKCEKPTYMDLGSVTFNSASNELSRLHEDSILNKRFFDVSCGIGYDAAICEEALSSPIKKVLNKFGLGKLVYLCIALKQLLTTKRYDAVMILDNEKKIEMKSFLFAAFMIHQYEGGGFMFCPNADYKDGVLDICAVSETSTFGVLRALPSALKGKHYKYNGIEKYSSSKIVIETKEPCWVHTDGEVTMKSNSITIQCEKEKLQMLL